MKIIKDNKIIVLVILIVLFGYMLFLCKKNNESFVDNEAISITDITNNGLPPKGNGFRIIDIKEDSITVEFYAPESSERSNSVSSLIENNSYTNNDIKGYFILLAKYNNNSNDAEPIDGNYRTVFIENNKNNVDSIIIPRFNSEYFTKTINMNKENGDDNSKFYYRIGLIVAYKDGTQSNVVNVSNLRIKKSGYFFQLGNENVGQADIEFEEYLKFKSQQPENITIDDTCENSANGDIEFIKRNLGGYPENLFIDERTGPKSLKELAKRQLSLGILDINVHTKEL